MSSVAFENRTPNHRLWIFLAVFACVALASSQQASAQSNTQSQDDIVVEISHAIESCPDGGYYPLPLKILNRGPAATIRVEARAEDEIRQTVGRTIVLGQNASSQFSLLIPAVSPSNRFQLHVTKDGRWLSSIKHYWGDGYYSNSSGSWLVIADGKPKLDPWISWKKNRGATGYYRSNEPACSHIVPSKAFETWLAYTSLETVAIDASAFASKLTEPQRNELLRWVSAGGTLLVFQVDLLQNKLDELDKSINWDSRAAVGPGWSNQHMETAAEISRKPIDKEASGNERMLVRGLMLGRVVAVKDDPFEDENPGLVSGLRNEDWSWHKYEQLVDQRQANTMVRNGVNPRSFAGDFLKFVNPGIQIVPTWGFIVLITIFAILIGPANYWFLKRRNKIGNLLWTTPLLALITTLGLLGWSSIANGTGSRVRMRSFTWLDQRSQVAVSMTRAAMFSGRAPGSGIRFEPYSAVYPVWPTSGAFKSGEVDWTDAQVFDGDFHNSNTRTQLFIVTPHTLRSRLRIEPTIDDQMPVSNGLEWALENILVCDHKGTLFTGDRLKPGESQKLRRATGDDIAAFAQLIASQKLIAPRVKTASPMASPMGPSSAYSPYGYTEEAPQSDFGSSYLERYLGWFQRDLVREGMYLPPGTWLGIVAEHPDLDLGLRKFTITEQLHVMMGSYDE